MSTELHAFSSVSRDSTPQTAKRYKLAAPAYLSCRPLLRGLEKAPEVDLARGTPAQMRGLLAGGEASAVLIPTIELQRLGGKVTVLPAGCIAAAGRMLTIRVFSRVRPEQITHLWVDNESRSGVALAQILWYAEYRRRISTIPYPAAHVEPPRDAQAALLVGDKCVANPPLGFDWQIDLGSMWFQMTGLPFVMMVWATLGEGNHQEIFDLLRTSREQGQRELVQIAHEHAAAYGWPEDLAEKCLTRHLSYEFTDSCREGLEEFLDIAAEMHLIDHNRPLNYFDGARET